MAVDEVQKGGVGGGRSTDLFSHFAELPLLAGGLGQPHFLVRGSAMALGLRGEGVFHVILYKRAHMRYTFMTQLLN